ncbi:MAG: T9SS C-terminal target domain-containing protein [Myxococcales bacterium]|nr:T9SS C-terminal target domain-containing protein [Myxococcales bacterium]
MNYSLVCRVGPLVLACVGLACNPAATDSESEAAATTATTGASTTGDSEPTAADTTQSTGGSATTTGASGSTTAAETATSDTATSTTGDPGEPLLTDMRMFIFGHSLINHEYTDDPPPSDELSVPHWMYLLADNATYQYAASGQYGFLPQHADLPPIAQWGFDVVPPAWDSDLEPFADADFTTVLLTAGNFIQYKGPDEPYDGDNPNNYSPVSATTLIVDWVREQEPGITIYIYENWPDMAGVAADFPPTQAELDSYHAFTQGEFHTWWLAYQDALLAARPDADVRMLPVGPTIARLLTETPLSGIPLEALYEDDAPHGRPTIYFLAGLVTYMGTYGVPAPTDFAVPELVHPLVAAHYDEVVSVIWAELEGFTDGEGQSRVW